MTDPRALPTTSDEPLVQQGDGESTGLLLTLRRSWATFRSAPAPYLAIVFAFSLWAAATGLPGGMQIAGLAAFVMTWLIVLEAGSKRRAGMPVKDRTLSLVTGGLEWVVSIMAALVIGMLVFAKLSAFPEIVRMWLSACAGLAVWAGVGSFFWPTFTQPAFSEYETSWLARATTIGVAFGAARALYESLKPPMPETAIPACFAKPDIFGNATDTVSKATFGFALFGGVFFLALWAGGRTGRGLGRRCWPDRHTPSP